MEDCNEVKKWQWMGMNPQSFNLNSTVLPATPPPNIRPYFVPRAVNAHDIPYFIVLFYIGGKKWVAFWVKEANYF